MKKVIKKHPELDFLLLEYYGEDIVPTKQDKFVSFDSYNIKLKSENKEIKELAKDYDLYVKKKSNDNHKKFEEALKESIKKLLTDQHPYPRKTKLEVMIAITMSESRIKQVDIDNLIKSVLDCFVGLVFEDDSQIINVLGQKFVHPVSQLNSLAVGVRKVTGNGDSWFENIRFAYVENDE